jgi:hypothetical protein
MVQSSINAVIIIFALNSNNKTMRIKKFYGFIALTVVLLATSLTYLSNSRMHDMSVVSSSNVEALSSDDSRFIFGTTSDKKNYIIDTELNTVVYFFGSNKVADNGTMLNTCISDGAGCVLQLAAMTQSSASQTKTWLQNIGAAASVISTFVTIVYTVARISI